MKITMNIFDLFTPQFLLFIIIFITFAILSLSGCTTQKSAESLSPAETAEQTITVTIVYDNYPGPQGLTADWGFACVIQGLEKTILFDTGANDKIFLDNFRRLNFDPQQIDLVVISHPHSDHTNGLESFLKLRRAALAH